ncbi:hypothetical protein UPYG_G00059270 [Umbra pygmaea]|uniref:Uncharacterized protein n=1 Tax=Umbra pygmaea TaxID=75934 RepID=A0ABD0X8Z4_UMBPY
MCRGCYKWGEDEDGPDLPTAETGDCGGWTSSENPEGAVASSFTERQLFAEFNRIANDKPGELLFGAVDCYTPCFVTIFKSKKGSVGEKLAEIVQLIDSRKPNVTAVHTLVLQGLSVLLGDDPSNFYNTSFNSKTCGIPPAPHHPL